MIYKRNINRECSAASVLADMARELSCTDDWERRLENCLRLLNSVLPSDGLALGVCHEEWKVLFDEKPDDWQEPGLTLFKHYSALTAERSRSQIDKDSFIALQNDNPEENNHISIPIIAADQVMGVLHVRTSETEDILSNHAHLLSAASYQIGGYLKLLISETSKAQEELRILEVHGAIREAYEREHRISEVLQQALLPKVFLDLPGHEIVATYHPALSEAEVGGDFYDVFDLSDGWRALVMGDVSGKGLGAAVYTSMAKYMIRAYAYEDPEPKAVLKRLNEALSEFIPDETFITIFYGLLDTERNILVYANAGHEPPILYDPPSGAVALDVTGPAVGMLPSAGFSQRMLPIFPGNWLILYTDGITEARTEMDFFGIERLSEVVVKHNTCNATKMANAIYTAASDHAEGKRTDDAAILVMRAKEGYSLTKNQEESHSVWNEHS